ncbi:acetate--CoA ligase family protein [Povalibacter sp.]|uniref:acetate--CoA ligase family protein n=1 Tax=Povalibacter sp. TaxID=1962978 RepID=UPI002F3FE518
MTAAQRSGLARLFAPRSIAIVGASASPEKVGYQLVDALRQFDGDVFPLNPKASEVAGRRAYASLRDLPVVPDLVILGIPAAACPDVLREAAAVGVGGAVIVSGGFGEAGESGADLQRQLESICRDSGLRLLGPNTSGYTQPGTKCHACFLPTVQHFKSGPLGIVAQSGGVNLTLSFLARKQGLGLRLAVGLGNSVDVDAADVIGYLADDADTQVIAVHLEGVRAGRKLYDAITAATERKPVVVLPVGRAQVADFAESHTGNLMGAHAVTAAALRQAGAIVVDTTEMLIDCAAAFTAGRIPPKTNPGIGILTGQAGPGLIILDALRSAGVSVPPLSDATVAEVAKHLPPMTYLRNPIDTGRPSPAFADVLMAGARDPAIDALITFALDEPAALDPVAVFAKVKSAVRQPLIFATLGLESSIERTLPQLAESGIAAYQSPERAANAARALVEDSRARHRLATPAAVARLSAAAAPARDEAAAKALLAAHGIRSPRSQACRTAQEALVTFDGLTKPIVAKVLDAAITHKTEVGGVHLNIRTTAQLESALQKIDAIPGDRSMRGYLLEEMAPTGVDLILGARRDPSYGPTVLIGLGGIEAEALQDVSIRLAPLSAIDAREMLDELRGRALLDGWRGAPAVDRDAIIAAILAVADLICTQPALQELDINPLRCGPDGAQALDALMIWK